MIRRVPYCLSLLSLVDSDIQRPGPSVPRLKATNRTIKNTFSTRIYMVPSDAMDVLAPPLIWVEGGCYRFCESLAWPTEKAGFAKPCIQESNPQETGNFDDEAPSNIDKVPMERRGNDQKTLPSDIELVPIEKGKLADEISSNTDKVPMERRRNKQEISPSDIEVVPIEKGRYKHTCYIHKSNIPCIIGPKGDTLLRLQFNTDTTIKLPRAGDKSDTVIIGSNREAVMSARRQLDLIIGYHRNTLKFTHFLSIPMTDETIMANYKEFKNVVLNETAKNSRGVSKELFQKPEKLHLSLGILSLTSDDAIKEVVHALKECNEKIIKPVIEKNGPIKMKVQGIWVSDRGTMVNVLYGKVLSNNNVLQDLAEKIVKFFVDKGLMLKPRNKLKMHMTLMNVLFAVDKRNPVKQPLHKFYPSDILKKHNNYFFGENVLNAIHLSQRGSYDTNGYYATRSQISLVD